MTDKFRTIGVLLTLVACLATFALAAHEPPAGLGRQLIGTSPLANVPGHSLTAVIVELAPGAAVPSHRHAGFVFAYVLEGRVRSQLDGAGIAEFVTGESWVEPPGTVHSLTENPSATEKARLLAVFVAEDGAELTKFDH